MPQDFRLAEAFRRHASADPDRTALVIGDDLWTRGELAHLAERAAHALVESGAQPGGTIVAQYGTGAEEIAVALAASLLGCTFIPVPKRMGPYEVSHVLGLARPQVFAVHDETLIERLADSGGAKVVILRSLFEAGDSTPFTVSEPTNAVAVIGFTSGTTGQPKGVMHSLDSLAWTADRMRALADIQPGESIIVTGAGAGAPGFTFFTYLPLVHGITIVRAERWDPARVLELIQRHRCVWSVMVPTMLYQLLESQAEAERPYDASSVRCVTVGGAFISEKLIARARAELGVEVLRMYAMSECMAHSSMELSDPEPDRTSLDGHPGPGSEVAAFDTDGRRLADGEIGELGFKGPSLFVGYLGDREGRRMTSDGFFLSGDLGRVTQTGAVKVVGRIKDMIIRGGFNIDPTEVEELARRHDAVREVAVVGYPDEKFGERACAVVTLHPGANVDQAGLVDFLLSLGLSKEKLPEHLLVLDEMPTSPDGKFRKSAVADLVADDVGVERSLPHEQGTGEAQ